MRIFVYGTLKRGGRLHGHLRHLGAKYLRDTRIAGFALYKLCWYPGIVPADRRIVKGEIYEVRDSALATLDAVEGAPDLFKRVTLDFNDGPVQTYVYNKLLPENAEYIPSGEWDVNHA